MDAQKEKSFYKPIADWIEREKGCTSGTEHRFLDLALLTGDVVGEIDGRIAFACEVKLYPYPIGSAGYGAVGQALALRAYSTNVYVGLVASDMDDVGQRSWRHASSTRTAIDLFRRLGITPPRTFEEYLDAVTSVASKFFGDLNLGFLVVHEDERGSCTVHELQIGSKR